MPSHAQSVPCPIGGGASADYLTQGDAYSAALANLAIYNGNGYYLNLHYPNVTFGVYQPTDGYHMGAGFSFCNQAPPLSPGRTMGKSCKCAGDPIDLSTGNEFLAEEDVRLDYLTLQRYYNSQGDVLGAQLGLNWRHSFDRHLTATPVGLGTAATLYRPNGQYVIFTSNGAAWVAASDVPDSLSATTDGSGNIVSWTYFEASTRNHEFYNASGQLTTIVDPNGLITSLTYSTSSAPTSVAPISVLLTVTDPRGRQLNFKYGSSGLLSSVALPDGGTLSYSYDQKNRLKSVTYPDSSVRTYVYNETSLTGGSNLPTALTGIVDEAANRYASITYDSSGRATGSQLAGIADTTSLVFNTNGTTSVTYPTGAQTTFTFAWVNGASNVTSMSAPCGAICGQSNASATFDTNGYPASHTDFNGITTATTYNSAGLLAQQIDAQGTTVQRTSNLTWDQVHRVPLSRTILDSNGDTAGSSSWVYNSNGQLIAGCEADPSVPGATGYACGNNSLAPTGVRQRTYTYCNAVDGTQCPLLGLLLSVTGPRSDLTQTATYSYYMGSSASGCGTPGSACCQVGDLKTVTDALGHVTTFNSYDGAGRITRITDANGINTDLTYTARGWLATRSINGATTSVTYTSYGAVQSITDPDGVKTTYGYDQAHRLVRITDAVGNYVQYTLDAAGNKTAEQVFDTGGTLRKGLSRTYNALGQLTQVTDGLNHGVFNASFSDSYDGNGNLVHTADALGIQRKMGYDALNRLISTIDNYNGTDAATQNTQSAFAYDAIDRLEGVGDPDGLNTVYSYDGLSNATSVQSPDTGGTSYAYDAAGNVIQRTDANGVTSTHTYDALNRRTATTYSNSTLNVTYGYDEANSVTGCASSYPVGRLTRVIELSVTTVYCYDAHGNVTQKSQTQGTATDITGYGHTAADRLASAVTPSGTSVQYTHDAAGRISGVTVLPPGTSGAGAGNVVTAISYLPFGPIASYTLGNGQTVTRTYDANYALTDVVSPALNLHFARDAMGNVTALGNAPGANPAAETYAYDPLYRLTGLYDASGNPEESYTYSKTGDRLSKTASGLVTGTYTYQTGTHHLTGIGNTTRTFDANGNTTSSSVASNVYGFGYNGRNRMTVVQSNGSTVGTYTYNALGQRIAKVATFPVASNQRFVYDEGSQLLGEYGSNTRDYIWLGNLPVATVDTTGTTSTVGYVHADGLNTPRVISDGTGSTQWSWSSQGNAFGEQQPATANGFVYNFRFPGQYYDTESGLANNVNRDHEAATGRYLQSDPLGLFGGQWSTYAYVGGQPLNRVDPLGTTITVRSGGGDYTQAIVYLLRDRRIQF